MKNLHLSHIEDLVFDGDTVFAIDILATLNDALNGIPVKNTTVSTKYDGAPAVVFGIDPSNGKSFVGTKSVFNKRIPKIAYTHDDINRLYGSKPELAAKLQLVAESVGKFTPGVYQADLLWYSDIVKLKNGVISFTPNTITYSVLSRSRLAESVMDSDVGLVVHTIYDGPTLSEMNVVRGRFPNFDDSSACIIDPEIDMSSRVMTEADRSALHYLIDHIDKMPRTPYYNIEKHTAYLRMFANYCARMGEAAGSVDMYAKFLENRNELDLAAEVHEGALKTEFNLWIAIAHAKSLIIQGLHSDSMFDTHVNGNEVKHEGYVVNYHDSVVKLVDRLEFSRLNFMNKKFEKV